MVNEGWQYEGNLAFFNTHDNCIVDELINDTNESNVYLAANGEAENLGLHMFQGHLYTSNYVGICRLKDVHGNAVKKGDKEVILRIEPRFSLKIINLLNYIKDDDEFDRYLAPQTVRYDADEKDIDSLSQNEVFKFFDDELPIHINDGVAIESSIITISVFLSMLKRLCRRPLYGKMQKKEDNLVGKLKGKIVFHKNIRNNTIRGRDDRFYCQYLHYTEDVIENQILKAALNKAKRFVIQFFGSAAKFSNNSFTEIISYCNKSLAHISLKKMISKECDKVKFSGCYAYYKPVIKMAKMVLDEVSIESSGKVQASNYVIPYAISMEKVFEVYVRAYLKKHGILSYKEYCDTGIQMSKFDEKQRVFIENKENSGDLLADYISGNLKPDIILTDLETQKTVIFDVKYKDYENAQYSRKDRLQLLAYSMMYNADNIGLVFPDKIENKNSIFEAQKINSKGDRTVHYHQMLLNIKENDDDTIIADYIKNIFKKKMIKE